MSPLVRFASKVSVRCSASTIAARVASHLAQCFHMLPHFLFNIASYFKKIIEKLKNVEARVKLCLQSSCVCNLSP